MKQEITGEVILPQSETEDTTKEAIIRDTIVNAFEFIADRVNSERDDDEDLATKQAQERALLQHAHDEARVDLINAIVNSAVAS